MSDSSFRKALNRGFTLIELMIVIVILGVLMGTILPRLTGAQARARDTGRVADLNTLSQALETYYDDNGHYPGTSGIVYCLDPSIDSGAGADFPHEELGSYLKGGVVPTAPSEKQVTELLAATGARTPAGPTLPPCVGTYLYIPLKNRGLARNGYAIITDVETWQNANVDSTLALPAADPSVKDYSDRLTDLGAETVNARASAYMVVN